MSISYNGIVGNKAKVTNPSIESWYTNNNILKDPPKSIMTRRIDKVNQDGSLNEMMYESGDRFAESINVYARGVNPMVSVDYHNKNGAPSKMPYRIIRDGAYRPPILRQEQLLPLSRLPRNVTQAVTNNQYNEYKKNVTCPDTKRYFKTDVLRGQIVPSKYVKVEMPVKEHFVVNYINENPLSGVISTQRSSNQQNVEIIRPDITLQKNTPLTFTETNKVADVHVRVEPSSEIQLVRNIPEHNATTTKTADLFTRLDDNGDIVLERNIPAYMTQTNKYDQRTYIPGETNTSHQLSQKTVARTVVLNKSADMDSVGEKNRSFNRLGPALSQGEFSGTRAMPQIERTQTYNTNYTTGKGRIAANIQKYKGQ